MTRRPKRPAGCTCSESVDPDPVHGELELWCPLHRRYHKGDGPPACADGADARAKNGERT